MRLRLLSGRYAVAKLAEVPPPGPWSTGEFWSLSAAPGEITLVCAARHLPAGAEVQPGWRALQVEGPLAFSMVGVMADLSTALASRGISLLALSTFDTDYLLVRESTVTAAAQALRAKGHEVAPTGAEQAAAAFTRAMTSVRGRRVTRLVLRDLAAYPFHASGMSAEGRPVLAAWSEGQGAAVLVTDGTGPRALLWTIPGTPAAPSAAWFSLLKDSLPRDDAPGPTPTFPALRLEASGLDGDAAACLAAALPGTVLLTAG